MYSKILILRFPKTEVHKPIVCHLTKDYNLLFNILNAAVLPRKEGIMALELSGTKKNFTEGVKFLKSQFGKMFPDFLCNKFEVVFQIVC